MKELFSDGRECFGCGACVSVCPKGAINMKMNEEGFLYPAVDERRCTGCGLCNEKCPSGTVPAVKKGVFFAVRCRDEELLKNSSSGGAFSLLANTVLERGGMVCGAVFDRYFQVRHILGQDITQMRKSKYVQSDMSSCFVLIQQALEAGKEVLFSGTPCQCHGLAAFFGGKTANLCLVSLVCRGVASPGFWKDYIQWLGKGGNLEQYDFRDKRRRNDGHTVSYTTDGVEIAVPSCQDGFFRLYNLGLLYRPVCYSCPFCSPDNDFDFTIGDFWGVEKILPQLADGRGTSLVIARGPRAMDVMEKLKGKVLVVPCRREDILQPALVAPVKEPLLRRFLFRDFARKDQRGSCDIPLIMKKYCGSVSENTGTKAEGDYV